MCQCWCLGETSFEVIHSCLTLVIPVPSNIFLEQPVERHCYLSKVFDKLPVKDSQTNEPFEAFDVGGGGKLQYCLDIFLSSAYAKVAN